MMRRMRTSNRGLKLLMSFEGFRSRAMTLGDGRWVIGYGHTQAAREGAVVSKREAIAILQKYDLPPIEDFIADTVLAPLNQNEFDALVSLVFNIGQEAFRTSNVLAFLNSGEKLAAGEAFTAWRKAQLNGRLIIVDALIRRRAAEKALFMRHPGGTPIAPSAHIRPVLDEDAARFVPSETPMVVTRQRKPVTSPAVNEEPLGGDHEPKAVMETPPEVAPAQEDAAFAEFDSNDGAQRFVVPDSDLVPVSAIHEPVLLVDEPLVETPVAPVEDEVQAAEHTSDKTAPELAAGALVARLTRILGEPNINAANGEALSQDTHEEDGPTPDEITRAISELAEGTSSATDDLPPLPEDILTGDVQDVSALKGSEELAQIEAILIDDLEPVPEAVLQKPLARAGANTDDHTEPTEGAGFSWVIYILLGLAGALFAAFGLAGSGADPQGFERGVGQFGYIGLKVLGGLLMLLSLYFLFKTYRLRK